MKNLSKKTKDLLTSAQIQRKLGKLDEALVFIHQAVENEPNQVIPYYLLATTYLEAGENEIAEQYCDQALQIAPLYKEALELKAILYSVLS
jgi:tetratricopeptide (TPR) repeat protein